MATQTVTKSLRSIFSVILPLLVLLTTTQRGSVFAADSLRVGDTAPSLSVEVLLNAPERASAEWDRLKGKVVVVEFWATWCAPCIASIPHLNELADQFRTKEVVFISLTDESRDTVDPFLRRKPIKGWVALDTDGKAGEAYGVTGIPRTFIIGRDGKILGETYPSELKPEHIEKALRGEPLGMEQSATKPAGATVPRERKYGSTFRPGEYPLLVGEQKILPEPLAQVIVRPALDLGGGSRGGAGKNGVTWINIDATSAVKQAYSQAFDIPDSRVDVRAHLPNKHFDIVIKTATYNPLQFRRLVEAGLGATFGLATRIEDREVDVLLLKAPDAKLVKLMPTVSTGGSGVSTKLESGRMVANVINGNLSGLASTLESTLNTPVFDESRLTARYDFDFILPKDIAEASKSLGTLGLTLEKGRRKLSYLVVEQAGKD